jgi:hypothetical protein
MSDAAAVQGLTAKPEHASHGRPLPLAQVVWQRTVALSDVVEEGDPHAVVLEVARTAGHDVSVLALALAVGRSRVRQDPKALVPRRATRLLERTITFLGVRPQLGEIHTDRWRV